MTEPAPSVQPISVGISQVGDQVSVASIAGEIDMLTEAVVRDAVRCQLAAKPRLLVLDLTEVGFMASSGLDLILQIQARALEQGTRLSVVANQGSVRRLLSVSGVDTAVDLHHDLGSALRSC
ncbi:hypothetical protein GCM10011609_33080 [Lentzea pudingi]|uniref:Anti-sigma factor antagonist n=1 Tax=Lentzea pudingi TaxID=1789439 RepID=A0ABQ2HVN4_9PSEU|nr:hypothetical protein GCM10011609_33080 [Lentzea pudingi]